MFISDQIDLTYQALLFTGLLILPVWFAVYIALRKLLNRKRMKSVAPIKKRKLVRTSGRRRHA